jgi:putative oxidoreductase
MKKIVNINPYYTHTVLLFLRIGIAILMLVHGIPKLNMLFAGEAHLFPAVLGMSPTLSLVLAVLAEVGCSVLILVGLGTRLAVVPLIVTMLIAVLYVHGGDPFSAQELGIHYVLVYAALLVMGSGRFSVDHVLATKLSN